MSQVTEQSVRFQTALASIKLIQASAVLDLTEDDFDFLTSNKVWIATDRSRARRKPAIEACGISTLSQSPMLGFHKQMDNRIKLLEEILSFRMQGVEFDNGDMYVDGHKAASDVR